MTARCGNWLNLMGDLGYDFLLCINRYLGHIRRIFGFRYWSLASFIKNGIKNAMQHISTYEQLLSGMAREHEVEGIICGHIHYPHLRNIQGIEYFNTGDWVEHCTALVETTKGEIKLIRWTEFMELINPEESTPIKIAA
jgi:UDP-2,3-diacylglucosamine pyrophosphatase LpxH